jgi:hypothetical protein
MIKYFSRSNEKLIYKIDEDGVIYFNWVDWLVRGSKWLLSDYTKEFEMIRNTEVTPMSEEEFETLLMLGELSK